MATSSIFTELGLDSAVAGGLASPTSVSEEELLAMLSQQLNFLLDTQRDWLLSKLYRLDVLERDIQAVLQQPGLDPALGLAQLILKRHYERQLSRSLNPPLPEELDEELGDLSW